MRILQVSHKIPFPALDGGSIVIHSLTKGLIDIGHEVQMVSIASPKRKMNAFSIDASYKKQVSLITVDVDTTLKPLSALQNLLFQKESYHTSRFNAPEFGEAIQRLLQQEKFDVIQLESIFVLNHIPIIRKYSNAPIVLRTQNIEHVIWESISKNESNLLKQWYLKKITKRLKKFEMKGMKLVDAIIPITEFDAEYIRSHSVVDNIVTAIPFGIDTERFTSAVPKEVSQKNSIFHLGSMDWMPNLEAVDWFLDEVWSKGSLSKKVDLFLAGKFMPERLLKLSNENVFVEGNIDTPIDYMLDKNIMIVPLRSGSGIRVKIIEGMALGKLIISTSLGANGIKCTNGENIIIADTPKEFEVAILKCLSDDKFCKKLSKNAMHFALTNYDFKAIAAKFESVYNCI